MWTVRYHPGAEYSDMMFIIEHPSKESVYTSSDALAEVICNLLNQSGY
jgi:hypothetical protein